MLQSYENFTGGVMMSIVEHGFCAAEEVNEFFTLENLLAPGGKLPLNTSGGNLAECYMHGLGLNIEAVRQIRGDSTCQVPAPRWSMVVLGSDGHPGQLVHLRCGGHPVSATTPYLAPGLAGPAPTPTASTPRSGRALRRRGAAPPALQRVPPLAVGAGAGSATAATPSTSPTRRLRRRA